jgi:hypothetical protein
MRMLISKGRNLGRALLAVLVVALCASNMALAQSFDLLRTVPLEIKEYEVSKDLPVTFATADQIIQVLDSSPVLLVHMEVLRRGYSDLPDSEKEKLVAALLKRHQQQEHDLPRAFDHGYAQLIYKNNKTGLFYLRKVNDKLQNQFTSLAYGMAQVEADLTLENSTPEEMTTRKMDAMYKLSDAVKLDALNHQPGFWPSYVRVIEKIKPLGGAYQSFSNRDFSLMYVPMGSNVIPMRGAQIVTMPLATEPEILALNAVHTSCNPETKQSEGESDSSKASAGTQVNETAVLQFFPTEKPGLYRVRVTGSYGQPLLSFETYSSNRIVEDLEGDGAFEIVARQYKEDPFNPILVYRYTPCGFELDKKIFGYFH